MASKVAIVGTGLVGSGWSIVFARAGHHVALFDAVSGAAEQSRLEQIERLGELFEAGLLEESVETVLSRISVAEDIATALADAFYVQESVFETVDIKRDVFTQIEPHLAPGAWVGSSSSGIAASLYSDHVNFRDRCLVVHPVNPPYLVPVVELVPAPWTSPETLVSVRDLMQAVGQAPVTLSREIEGFALNRLQAVLLMEAWRLVDDGIISVEDLDLTVSAGLGLRWSFMGPFETIDLNAPGGVADYAARLGPLYARIASSRAEHAAWSPPLIAKVTAARRRVLPLQDLTDRRGWRDRRLMALAAHRKPV